MPPASTTNPFALQEHSAIQGTVFVDGNKDGVPGLSSSLAGATVYLDLNHDGFLSPAEFQAWPRALKTKDAALPDPSTAPSGSAGAQHMPPT